MQLQLEDEVDGVLNLTLVGRLDTPGVDIIETRLTAHIVPRGGNAMIDLSQVSFIGSGGIRMFITIARALGRKNAKLVLYGAQPLVAQVFETTSLNQIVPVRSDATAAVAVVRG
jgi:anti-anti-sigma factor